MTTPLLAHQSAQRIEELIIDLNSLSEAHRLLTALWFDTKVMEVRPSLPAGLVEDLNTYFEHDDSE